MGIHCETKLHTPPSGAFIGLRGNVISGVIKYVIQHPMAITGIIASVEGTGTLTIEYLQKKDDEKNPETEIRRETYLDVNIAALNYDITFGVGVYEMPFKIEIPHNIPPSLNYHKSGLTHNITCEIVYCVRIKFIMPSFYKFVKRFTKEINIISGLVPTLPMTRVSYNAEKKLTQVFSCKKSYVRITATTLNSVCRCGEKIRLECEVINDTNIVVKGIKIKVVEIFTFKPTDHSEIVMQEKVPETDSKSASLQSGDTQQMFLEINMPEDRESLEYSKIVSRQYLVLITVKLPIPHRNFELKIPLQVGHIITYVPQGDYADFNTTSYWERMQEDLDDILFTDRL